jgi:hypothetical protein
MYKIFKNEIKISQFLKGGSEYYIKEGDAFRGLNLGDGKLDFNLAKPFFEVPILYNNFDFKMLSSIIETLNMYNYYKKEHIVDIEKIELLKGELNKVEETLKKGVNEDESKLTQENIENIEIIKEEVEARIRVEEYELKLRMTRILRAAIGNLKELGLFDHYTSKFIEFDTFVDSIISEELTIRNKEILKNQILNIMSTNIYSKSIDQLNKMFIPVKFLIFFLLKGGNKYLAENDITKQQKTQIITNISNEINKGISEDLNNFFENIKYYLSDPYPIKQFYDDYKILYNEYKDDIDCSKIYFRQIFKQPLIPSMVNRRFFLPMQGGNYDQLDYMLNGGSINTIVRIPNLSSYFKSQLKFIDNKLKSNNKKLSENSRRDIEQIIDSLEKHEKNLKDQFELLKSAYLVEEDTINVKKHKQEIIEAQKSLSKHKRYIGPFGDLINNLEKIANGIDKKEKPLDKFFS